MLPKISLHSLGIVLQNALGEVASLLISRFAVPVICFMIFNRPTKVT